MRFLRSHHIAKLLTAVDAMIPPEAPNPQGGRPDTRVYPWKIEFGYQGLDTRVYGYQGLSLEN